MGKWGERSAPTCSYLSYVSSTSFKLFQYFPDLTLFTLLSSAYSSWSGDQGIQPILTSSEQMCCKIGPHYLERFNNHRELIQSQETELEGDTKNYKISSVEPQPLSHRRNLLTSYCFNLNKIILKREQIENSIAIYMYTDKGITFCTQD